MKALLTGRWAKAGLKLAFLTLVGGWIAWQIDLDGLWRAIRSLPLHAFLGAILLLVAAQFASAARMRVYAQDKGLPLTMAQAAALYGAGMFYNTLLPGGIGGDGYKIWMLNRKLDLPTGDGIRLMLAERASGLLILILLFLPCFALSRFAALLPGAMFLLPLAGVVTVAGYVLVTPAATRESRSASLHAAGWSLGVQGLTLAGALVIWQALTLQGHVWDYAALYLLSCVAAVLPVTIGGMGMRELIFFQAVPYALDSAEKMLGFALLCSAVYLVTALLAGLAVLWMPRVDWSLDLPEDDF